MLDVLKRLVCGEEGQGLSEYALIIALVAVLLVGSLIAFKDKIVDVFNDINQGFESGQQQG